MGVSDHVRLSGHRFLTNSMICHPNLSLVLTTSQAKYNDGESMDQFMDEIILWRTEPIGPLTNPNFAFEKPSLKCLKHSFPNGSLSKLVESNDCGDWTNYLGNYLNHDGLVELARFNVTYKQSSSSSCFNRSCPNLAWFPCLVGMNLTISPISLFVASVGPKKSVVEFMILEFFIVLTDSQELESKWLEFQASGDEVINRKLSDSTGRIVKLDDEIPESSYVSF